MARVYELSSVRGQVVARELPRQLPPGFVSAGRQVRASAAASGDDFTKRVTERRVDLLQRIKEGIPPLDYLPKSEGMLIRGKRHLIPGPKKAGKSIAMLVHWTAMTLAGARVMILDRENGANEYASRLSDIMVAWDLKTGQRKKVNDNLHYFAFPTFKSNDGYDLAELAHDMDVVVFDATRMFLSDLGLKEDSADDYSAFMNTLIDPLFQSNVATVILDNTGHNNTKRARATSAKGDLNEVLFSFEKSDEFSMKRQGKVRLEIADSRFGNDGKWVMPIGGGTFVPWKRVDEEKPVDPVFRRAVEEVLAATAGISQTKLIEAVRARGVSVQNEQARHWLAALVADTSLNIHQVPSEKKTGELLFYGGPTNDAAEEPGDAS